MRFLICDKHKWDFAKSQFLMSKNILNETAGGWERKRERKSECLMKYTPNSERHTLHRQNSHLFLHAGSGWERMDLIGGFWCEWSECQYEKCLWVAWGQSCVPREWYSHWSLECGNYKWHRPNCHTEENTRHQLNTCVLKPPRQHTWHTNTHSGQVLLWPFHAFAHNSLTHTHSSSEEGCESALALTNVPGRSPAMRAENELKMKMSCWRLVKRPHRWAPNRPSPKKAYKCICSL